VRVVKTETAQEDLIEIWANIAADSEPSADRFLDQVGAKLDLLPDFPELGVSRDDLRAGFRMLVVGEYLILYHLLPDEIEIVRVVHGRMNLHELPL
jgi:toxin ParE1/3/4